MNNFKRITSSYESLARKLINCDMAYDCYVTPNGKTFSYGFTRESSQKAFDDALKETVAWLKEEAK